MSNAFSINSQTGCLTEAAFLPSPHQDERPHGVDIDMIVIHGISLPPGQFGTKAVEAFFCAQLNVKEHPYFAEINHLKVSAHLFIKRDGEIVQFVPFHKRAWHAGESSFKGKNRCNDFSIGIELEGTDHLPYETVQYAQLARIIILLRQTYSAITPERIVGHADIAPGRKTDPGPAFNWKYLEGILA